jgi:hypothetical protein
MIRYKLTDKGTLLDTKSDKKFMFTKVRAERKGRLTMVHFRLHDGTDVSAARHTIDTNGIDLGIGEVSAPAAKTKGTASREAIPAQVHVSVSIVMTRDELLTIHQSLQSAADLTLRKVVESLR